MERNKKLLIYFFLIISLAGIHKGSCAIEPLINHPQPAVSVVELESRAYQGDIKAQNELGYKYLLGDDLSKNYKLAFKWFRKAAEQGSFLAQFKLGDMYFVGLGVIKDPALAAIWLGKAAEQGFPDAQTHLGSLYSSGTGLPQDYGKAAEWYHKAAEQGYPTAQEYLADLYAKGHGVLKDIHQSEKWLKKAFDQKIFQEFQHNIAVMYKNGSEEEYTDCFRWYRKTGEQGYKLVQEKVAKMYEDVFPVSKNYAETIEYYRIMGEILDIPPVQTNLGFLYANGYGVLQDYTKALKCYHKAAEQFCAHAQRRLGEMYEQGLGVEKNIKTAMGWYEKSANEHDAEAQKSLHRIKKLSPNK